MKHKKKMQGNDATEIFIKYRKKYILNSYDICLNEAFRDSDCS